MLQSEYAISIGLSRHSQILLCVVPLAWPRKAYLYRSNVRNSAIYLIERNYINRTRVISENSGPWNEGIYYHILNHFNPIYHIIFISFPSCGINKTMIRPYWPPSDIWEDIWKPEKYREPENLRS
jgi:hypothetical protein